MTNSSLLPLILYLVSGHSFLVGLILITRPARLMALTDLARVNEPFFPVQGGMFHIIMAVGYGLAATNIQQFSALVVFSIIVKFMATAFLLIYHFKVQAKMIVLASGVIDGLMGIVILLFYIGS